MDELKERSKTEYVSCAFSALSAAYLGELDEAFEYLEKAYEERDTNVVLLKYEPWVPAILKNDPRFQKFLARVGYP